MNNTIIIAVAIVAAAVILKLPIGPQPGRYQIVAATSGLQTITIRLDTMTGDGWEVYPGPSWMPFSNNGVRR